MIKLFCDGSVNPQKKIGFAAYFILDDNISFKDIKINIKKFEDTSSTKLELETLLWALEEEKFRNEKFIVYTDCQNILSLETRRNKLEASNYLSSSGKKIKNEELYKKFFILLDSLDIEFKKIKGHKKSSLRDNEDKLFNLVDKASRKALREYLS